MDCAEVGYGAEMVLWFLTTAVKTTSEYLILKTILFSSTVFF